MTRRKPGKRWRRTGNEEDPNKRPRRIAQLSSLPEATNVHVETDQQYLGCSTWGTRQEVGVPPGGAQNEQVQPPVVHAGSTPLTLEHQTSHHLPAQGSMAQESMSTVYSFEDYEESSSRSAFRDPPDGLTTELQGSVEYDPSQSFEEALPDVGVWTYDDGHMFREGFEEDLSEECAEESNFKDTTDKPLYDNASITVSECLLIIMAYVSDLLKMLKLLCPDSLNTNCLNSIQKFKDFFFSRSASSPIVLHKYCSNCFGSLESAQLECLSCGATMSEEKSSSFIEIPIEAQIRSLFLKPGFQEKLNFRFSRKKTDPNNVEDIYDAEVYKQLVDGGGPLSDPKNISLTWNTDGVPIFKSSKFSVWPFYCVINELNVMERTKRENMIFAGLWYGDAKPSMVTFLRPLSDTLSKLADNGILVQPAGLTSEPFLCKVLTIAGTCDLPAKALVLNSVQYNGKFGCHKCEQPGETVRTGERGHVHAFPYQHGDPKGPLRTNEKFAFDMKIANETKTTVKGVKGPCWLSKLKGYNLIKGTGIDYMHSVLLGVMRLLMVMWFSTEFSRQPFSMAKNAKEIDRRFQGISPPSSIRYPRSVASHRMFFKASEYRDLLIFYGPVVFRGILATLYYNHFLLLSEAIFILLMESISFEQIDHAEKLLWNFCSQMADLYGVRYQTANVHLLVHLADSVRALGPLWTHSCFHFEDKNGYLLRLIHGTQNIPMQMVHAVKLVQSIPVISQTIKPGNAIAEFYTRMTKDNSFCQENNDLSRAKVYGASSELQLDTVHISSLERQTGHCINSKTVKVFHRAQVKRNYLTSKHYGKGNRRNHFTVVFSGEGQTKYGQIEFFFTSEHSCAKWALVHEFKCAGFSLLQDDVTNGTCSHVVPLLETSANTVVSLDHILGKVVFLDLASMPGIVFAAHFPNTLEKF
ncbi:uncharacterized protein LOC121680620 isoform X3 [Alosa sapidissima]|uniref:uncharacterized protein LOC121680620 isoform X3 n=1 Tax=Alosa sapidissima TaxID=34773 RepID=UPI001C08F324|nr:uncharacterized protein LOC121680620 isoform X3 [Alosa sapidissima]